MIDCVGLQTSGDELLHMTLLKYKVSLTYSQNMAYYAVQLLVS
jgi:hypothetical protein